MDFADQPAGGHGSRVGDRLRSAREAQHLSLDEVASHTRVPKRLLEAIESGDHGALPAPTYSAGFVKVYAQLVGLDGAELASQFRNEIGRSAERRHSPEPFEPADPARVPSRLLALVAVAVALLIALGYAVWRGGSLWGYGADERARLAAGTESLAVPEAAPAPASPAPAEPAANLAGAPSTLATAAPVPPPPAGPVTLAATQTVWFKVYERGGKVLFQGEVPAGNRYEVPADAVDPLIRTSRPEALQVSVGDRPLPPLGPPAKLVKDLSLARDALLARAAAAPAAATSTVPTTEPTP